MIIPRFEIYDFDPNFWRDITRIVLYVGYIPALTGYTEKDLKDIFLRTGLKTTLIRLVGDRGYSDHTQYVLLSYAEGNKNPGMAPHWYVHIITQAQFKEAQRKHDNT